MFALNADAPPIQRPHKLWYLKALELPLLRQFQSVYGLWCVYRVIMNRWGLQNRYFKVTVLLAEPPRLLLTVIFCGFVDHVKSPR